MVVHETGESQLSPTSTAKNWFRSEGPELDGTRTYREWKDFPGSYLRFDHLAYDNAAIQRADPS
jgi:hypothetical protein